MPTPEFNSLLTLLLLLRPAFTQLSFLRFLPLYAGWVLCSHTHAVTESLVGKARPAALSGVSDFVRRPRERGARCGKASRLGRGAAFFEGCGGQQRREGRRALMQLGGAPPAFVHARGCREAVRSRVPTPRGGGLAEADVL